MQKNLFSYFKKADTYELPDKWLNDPLPKAAEKRPVGRPKKLQKVDPEVSCVPVEETTGDCSPEPSTSQSSVTSSPAALHPTSSPVTVTAVMFADSTPTGSSEVNASMPPSDAAEACQFSPSVVCRKRYKAYTATEKRAIVDEAKANPNGIRATAREHDIAIGTLMGWMKKGEFNDVVLQNKKGARTTGGGRKLSVGEGNDEKIFRWIIEQRELHVPVSCQAIMDHAKLLCAADNPTFQASRGWLQKFMKRHELSLRSRTSLSQRLPADLEEKISSFQTFVKTERSSEEIDDRYIVNMDETPVFFDIVPNKTVEQTGNKSVIIRSSGSDKKHVTVMLAVSATGDVLPTIVIFKGKRPLRDIQVPNPKDVIVLVQEKAWVDERVMLEWIDACLLPYTNRNDSLLVMDSFRCHIMESVKKRLRKVHANLAVIPGNFMASNM